MMAHSQVAGSQGSSEDRARKRVRKKDGNQGCHPVRLGGEPRHSHGRMCDLWSCQACQQARRLVVRCLGAEPRTLPP